jgi:hypothetical protein
MSININKKLKNSRRPKVINKTFDDFRQELINYASSSFSNQIKDFSESSLGGMFLDFAAVVGESMSFYLEQQFDELNYETSSNTNNIQRHLRQAGINSNFSSPAITKVSFFIEVPSDGNSKIPLTKGLPIIKKFTEVSNESGINFILNEDLDFRDSPVIDIGSIDQNNEIITLVLRKDGICTSGKITNETITFPSNNQNLFLSYDLSNQDVTKILSVVDNSLNTYYEVESLSQDTVYKKIEYSNNSFYNMHYASHRFVREDDLVSGTSRIRFGNGRDVFLKDDIITNPEDITLPLAGRGYDSNFSLDPKKLLNTNTLGVSPQGKTLSIRYQYGGGINHNVPGDSISTVEKINIDFPEILILDQENDEIINFVTESISINNEEKASGGSNRMNLQELVQLIPAFKKMQNRIISHEDMIARIYTMPSDFGRVSKASILENPFSNLSKNLYVVCKDIEGKYTYASDSLKINLKNHLDEFRLIGDSYNILDSPIYNFGIDIVVKTKSGFESRSILNEVYFELMNNMRFDSLEIGEGININDIILIALSVEGVISVISETKDILVLKTEEDNFYNEDISEDIEYSNNKFSVYNNYNNGFVYPPEGGIFELKYEDFDIKVRNG